jgi:hypothetical protein
MSEEAVVGIIGYVVILAVAVFGSRMLLAAARRERLKTRIVVRIGADPAGMPTAADLADGLRIDVDSAQLAKALAELRAEGFIKAYMADGPDAYVTARGNVVGPLHYRLKGT